MFKGGRWRGEKNRIKVLFRLQFKATQVPASKGENLVITLIPVDVGKPTARSEKASALGGVCLWEKPLYETMKFVRDSKSGKIGEKIYHVLLSAAGFPKALLLGEATVDFSGYAEAIKPSSFSLSLKGFDAEVLLHVTIQRTQEELRRRENGEPQKTLLSQLSNSDKGDEDPENLSETNGLLYNGKSSPNLTPSRSFDAVSVGWSETSSIIRQDSTVLLSPLGSNFTPQRPSFSPSDYAEERKSNADEIINLVRQVEVSDLELQALRKQVVKERKLVLELSKQLKTLTEDRDRFKRESDELRKSPMRENERESLRIMLEEVRNELEKEKAQNVHLSLQLKNTSEMEDVEQYALEELVKEKERASSVTVAELNNEIEFHRKDREEMEMQMEQLALDYEILKQENHDLSSRLDQIQLREQLRMQYECSAHVAIISELEGHVARLEGDLAKQSEAFHVDLTAVITAKVELEKRVIELEEALRKTKRKNVMVIENLMDEIGRLEVEMFSMFEKNEKLRLRNSQLEENLKTTEDRYRSEIEELESEVALGKGHIERLYAKVREKTDELEKLRRSSALPEETIEKERNESRRFRSNGDIRKVFLKKEETRRNEKRDSEARSLSAFFEKYKERILTKPVEAESTVLSSHGIEDTSTKPFRTEVGAEVSESDDGNVFLPKPGVSSFTLGAEAMEQEIMKSDIGTEAAKRGLPQDHLAGRSSENTRLIKKNKAMEEELRELRERYSEISLKFAQVEGERQQLVMTVRTMKNAQKC